MYSSGRKMSLNVSTCTLDERKLEIFSSGLLFHSRVKLSRKKDREEIGGWFLICDEDPCDFLKMCDFHEMSDAPKMCDHLKEWFCENSLFSKFTIPELCCFRSDWNWVVWLFEVCKTESCDFLECVHARNVWFPKWVNLEICGLKCGFFELCGYSSHELLWESSSRCHAKFGSLAV